MPIIGYHACRIRQPGEFQPDSFRSKDIEIDGKPSRMILGRLKGEESMTLQAYRYPADRWTVEQARANCKSHDGIEFEPAAEEEDKMNEFWEVRCAANGKTGELLLYGDIGSAQILGDEVTPTMIDAQLKALGELDRLDVRVNSAGGNVFSGMAIYNIIKRARARIKYGYIDGLAASIASVIVMACDKVIMPSNAMMVVHNPFGAVVGNAAGMRKMADDLDKVRDAIVAVYREKAGMKDEDIIALMDAETWMTAEDAVKMGFADEMEEEVKIAASLNDKYLVLGGLKVDTSAFKNFQPECVEAYEPPVPEDDNMLKEQQAKFEALKAKLGCCVDGK